VRVFRQAVQSPQHASTGLKLLGERGDLSNVAACIAITETQITLGIL